MDKKKIYGKWSITDEIVGYPLMLHAWLKGKKVSQLLEKRIEIAKNKADKIEINLSKVDEYRIEYEELDNFFAHYFRKIDSSKHKSFEEKINYCLSQFKREANTLYSSSKLMILQGNFLNGAEKTIFLYELIHKSKNMELPEKREEGIAFLMGEEKAEKLLNFFIEKQLIGKDKRVKGEKAPFIRLHKYLQDEQIINPTISNKDITIHMGKEYKDTFDSSVFSRANFIKIKQYEKDIRNEIINLLRD